MSDIEEDEEMEVNEEGPLPKVVPGKYSNKTLYSELRSVNLIFTSIIEIQKALDF